MTIRHERPIKYKSSSTRDELNARGTTLIPIKALI